MASQNQSAQKWKFDVFFNCRQQDLDRSFVFDLYKRLNDLGIKVFTPHVNSKCGEQVSTEILEAIEESRIAITIFSKDYTSSPRCLEELTKIMECVDNKGQEFFFVFYKVKPSDGLSPLGAFEADIKGFNLEKVQRWKDALRIADDMAGSRDYFAGAQLSHWEDEKCIAEIMNKICQVPRITKYPVGIKSRVEEVKSLLKVEFGGVLFIGIWGRGGVGKTTVAREIFDEISCQFEGSCFLNVGRSLEKLGPGGPALLQWKLLIKILKQHPVNVASLNKEVDISQILRFKKVLIVLDDVYNSHQLEYLAGEHGWFGDGSRIITTTRNSDLLCKHDELYRVPELTNHEALELVSWHAFQQGTPVKEFQDLSCCIVDYAKGLPIALEVLGSFLYKQGTEEHSALHRLNSFGDGKIVKLLSLSLDACGIYKDMFLDIACFFRGKHKNYVMKELNKLVFISEMGINILTERSLLYVSEGTIEMHDWIVQMGRQVARDAEQLKPWNRSRLWHESDTKTVSAKQITRTLTFPVAPENESIPKWKYDAFLSFRGDDTRNNFVAHLYKRLEDIGINVFKDDVKLKRGKFISTELLKAIKESRTAIIIFSEDYASSTWCLEELTMIMECVDKKEQKAYPVFYNIEPSDLRMKGKNSSFARALDKHVEYFKSNFEKLVTEHEEDLQYSLQKVLSRDETVLKDNLEKVQRWKHALHKAAGIAGLDVRQTASGNEAESIEKIINDNFQIMHHSVSATEKYLVGIESRMGEVESLFKVRSGDVCFVGIWGIGGIGKTTVARAFFDKISYQFQGSCFLANVREESKKHGLTYLQDTLLSRLLNEKRMNIASFYEGADMIKRRLCHWKVLIVFDDVDDEHQLEYLVGNHDWFGDGSRIITTTRNQDLLRSHDQLYSVPELAKDEAVEVFSWHAFQKRTPDKEFLELSKSLVDYAKGLPLALKVFGSFLYKRGVIEWRSAIDKLKDTGHEKIVKQLSLSLDGLNHEEKNVFLDIACFFRGRKKDDVITILNSFGFRSEIGIDVLIQKSLLYISEGMVEMHDLIEQMGQQVARNVDQDKPWKHSRLWHEQDIKTVFSADQRTESIKGMMVPIGSDQHICKWSKAFRNMPCLRLLIVKGEEVWHHDLMCDPIECLPSNLKWLDWSYYSFESLPAYYEPGNLVGLHMTFSSLVEVFKEPKLRYLNITECQELKGLPELPQSIEELYAEDFLAKQSIAKLQKYPRLNLVSFTNYSFDQQSYTKESNGSSVLEEILCSFLSHDMDNVVQSSLNSDYRVTCSIVFPECAIPTWFKHQSVGEKMLLELPINWYNDKFKGFAICCATHMGAGVLNPDSGLSKKYDYAFVKAKLICKDDLEDLKVLEKECKVGTASRTYGSCVCFVYIPLYASLQVSGTDFGKINQYSLFEASLHGRIVRQWGVHLIYEDERTLFAKKYGTPLKRKRG